MINFIGVAGMLGTCSVRDIKTKNIKLMEALIFGAFGICVNIILHQLGPVEMLLGAAIGVFLLGISYLTREKIGKGDAVIVGVMGIYIGFMKTMEVLWIGSILALLVGAVLVKVKEEDRNYEIPFVPFLLAGYLVLKIAEYFLGAGL